MLFYTKPNFLQIYLHDPNYQLSRRQELFLDQCHKRHRNDYVVPIIEDIQRSIKKWNPLIRKFFLIKDMPQTTTKEWGLRLSTPKFKNKNVQRTF